MSSYSLKNLVVGNEAFGGRFEDDEATSVSIEVENEIVEEMEEQEEVVETVKDNDDTAEAAEEMMATFEYAERMAEVVMQCGWSKPVAMVFNHGQFNGKLGEVEEGFGITLPANESLEMIASPHDSNSIAVMAGFKDTMKSFWAWIKKIAKKIADAIMSLASKIVSLFSRLDTTTRRLAEAIAKIEVDEEKAKKKKLTIMSYAGWNALPSMVKSIADMGGVLIKNAERVIADPKLAKEIALSVTKDMGEALGIAFNADGSVNVTDVAEKLKGHDQTLSESGWTKAICSNTGTVNGIYTTGKMLPGLAKSLKQASQKLESLAARSEKNIVGDDKAKEEATTVRECARKAVVVLTGAQKAANKVAKVCFHLVRQYIKAQRAVYACKK